MPKPINLAIIRLSAMGDIIHSASILPYLLDALTTHHAVRLTWIIDSTFQEILEDSPYIHRLISIPLKQASYNPKALFSIYKTLRTETFDKVLDLQGLLKSALVAKALKASCIFGFQSPRESLARFFYDKRISIPYSSHILLRNATLAMGAFNLPIPPLKALKSPKPFLGAQNMDFPFLPNNPKKKNILCVLKTSKTNKTYPLENFLELARLLNLQGHTPIFLSQKPLEIPQNARILQAYHLSLTEIKSLVAQMDLVIGGDTGITHLAWALKRPSITLFGSTPKERFNCDTSSNLSLSANPNANYSKKDFSIHTISPHAIFTCAKQLLARNP